MLLGPMPSPRRKTDSMTESSVAVVSRPISKNVSTICHDKMSENIRTCNGHPIVHDHTRTHDRRTSVDATGDEGHLQQAGQLVLVLDGGLGVHDAALVAERHVRADQDVVGDGLAEDLDAQHICDSVES